LTVLEHELGHAIGLPDNTQPGDLMDITLGLGVRRSPTIADLATITGKGSGRAPVPPTASWQSVLPQSSLVDAALASILGTVGVSGDQPNSNFLSATPAASMGPLPAHGAPPRKKDQVRPSSLVAHRGPFSSRLPGKTRRPGQSSVSGPRPFEATR
jgi:hypothetical protein